MSDDGEGLEVGEIPLDNLSDLEEEAPEPVSFQNEAVKSEYKEIVIQPLYDDKTDTCGKDDTSDPPLPPPATSVHYACSFCKSTFGSAVRLEAHMQRHIWGRKEFESISDIPQPSTSATGSKIMNHACKFCELRFTSKKILNDHCASKHSIIYTCLQCKVRMTEASEMRKHMAVHVDEDNIMCKLCSRGLLSLKSLNQHMLIHIKKSFRCKTCGKFFCNHEYLMKHILEKHNSTFDGLSEKKLTIDVTGFACLFCPKVFLNDEFLQKHMAKRHVRNTASKGGVSVTKKAEGKFPCNKCFVDQGSAEALREHVNHICIVKIPTGKLPKHDVVLTTVEQSRAYKDKFYSCKLFFCIQCGTKFSTHSSFKEHLSHSVSCRDIPFKKGSVYECQLCGMRKNSLKELSIHVKQHSNEVEKNSVSHGKTSKKYLGKLPFQEDTEGTKQTFGGHSLSEIVTNFAVFGVKDNSDEEADKSKWPLCVCKLCGWEFIRMGSFARHVQEIHTDDLYRVLGKKSHDPMPSDGKNHQLLMCSICDNKFLLLESYKNHMKLSHGLLVNEKYCEIIEKTRKKPYVEKQLLENPNDQKKCLPRDITSDSVEGRSRKRQSKKRKVLDPSSLQAINSQPAKIIHAAVPQASGPYLTMLQVPNSDTVPAPASVDSLVLSTGLVNILEAKPAFNTYPIQPVPGNPTNMSAVPINTIEIKPLTVNSMQTSFASTTTTGAKMAASTKLEGTQVILTNHSQMGVAHVIPSSVPNPLSNAVQPNSSRKRKRKADLKPRVDMRTEMQFTTYTEAEIPCFTEPVTEAEIPCFMEPVTEAEIPCFMEPVTEAEIPCFKEPVTEAEIPCFKEPVTEAEIPCFKEPVTNEVSVISPDPKVHGVVPQPTKLYPCTECNAIFYSQIDLSEHLNRTHSPSFVCNICYKLFTSMEELTGHRSLYHTKHICGYCKQRSNSWLTLIKHVRNCTNCYNEQFENGILHPCRECHFSFRSTSDLACHKASAHSQKFNFGCCWCKKSYVSEANLQDHVKKKHPGMTKLLSAAPPVESHETHLAFYQCKSCAKVFNKLTSLLDHEIQHTSEVDESCISAICEKSSKAPEVPMKNRPKSMAQRHSCTLCGKKCLDFSSYFQHLEEHGSPNYHCRLCGKLYLKVDDVRKHMESHLGDRSYQCDICGHRFKTFNKAKVHMVSHNVQDVVPCPITGKVFLYKSWLKVRKKLEAAHKSTLKCEWCKELFKNIQSLWNHQIGHFMNGSHFYQCDECPLVFLSQIQCKKHVKEFHRFCNKFCTMCPCSFKSRQSFINHMEDHLYKRNPFLSPFGGCTDCIYGFSTEKEMVNHIVNMHGTEQLPSI